MCEWGDTVNVEVFVPSDLSCTHIGRIAIKPIDRCISDLVKALQAAKIWTRSSCCGHGKGDGEILLQDGRALIIKGSVRPETYHDQIRESAEKIDAVLDRLKRCECTAQSRYLNCPIHGDS